MYEIKTTEEINEYASKLIDRSGRFAQKLSGWDVKWVRVTDIKRATDNLFECLSSISYEDDELENEMCLQLSDVERFLKAMEDQLGCTP